MGCLAAASSDSGGDGFAINFTDSCLGLEASCSNPCGNGLINVLGCLEDGFDFVTNFRRNGLGFGRRDNQSGGWVVFCGWGFVEAHPWNWLGEFTVLFCPWNCDLLIRLGDLFVGRVQCIFQSLEGFEVGIVFRVLDSLDGIPQFRYGVDNGIRWGDRGLRYILVLEENCVGQSFCSCLFAFTCVL